MRELTYVNKQKEKKVYQLAEGEFQKGEWLKEVPSGHRVEIEYKANNRILTIHNTPKLFFRKSEKEQEEQNANSKD